MRLKGELSTPLKDSEVTVESTMNKESQLIAKKENRMDFLEEDTVILNLRIQKEQ